MNVALGTSFWIATTVNNDEAAVEAKYLKPMPDKQALVMVKKDDSTEPILTRVSQGALLSQPPSGLWQYPLPDDVDARGWLSAIETPRGEEPGDLKAMVRSLTRTVGVLAKDVEALKWGVPVRSAEPKARSRGELLLPSGPHQKERSEYWHGKSDGKEDDKDEEGDEEAERPVESAMGPEPESTAVGQLASSWDAFQRRLAGAGLDRQETFGL